MKLKDRVTVTWGRHIGRVGTVCSIDQFGVGVHLDHKSETGCDFVHYRHPDQELVINQ